MKSKSALQKDCEQVNQVLKAEAIRLRLGTKISLARLDACKGDLKAFSELAMMEFREYVRRALEKPGSMNAQVLMYEGARLLKLNPETTKRYLRTLRARGGPFAGLGDVVTLNPHYVAVEEDSYWLDEEEEDRSVEGRRSKAVGRRLLVESQE